MKYPATNSDSDSVKSNGGLAVSATDAIKNINNRGNNGIQYHTTLCVSIIVVIFNELTNIIIIINIDVNINSYDINWAVDLIEPNNEYLLLEDHPLNNEPNTPNEPIAKLNSIPKLSSPKVIPGPKGITTQPIKAVINVIKGLITKIM